MYVSGLCVLSVEKREYGMIELRPSIPDEIPIFVEMESGDDTAEFVFGWNEEKHRAEMQKHDVIYISILKDDKLAGFFVLAIDPDDKTVECRRIVVSNKHRGIGQTAINAMEKYCRTELGRTKIWLDVLETNSRAWHIYEKLGYKKFKKGRQEGKPLSFLNKKL